MKTLSRVGWVLVSSLSVALGACVIRTAGDGSAQTAANATATSTATGDATAAGTAAATTTTTPTATATTPAATATTDKHFGRRVGPQLTVPQGNGKLTGSNMFGAQSGSPTALKGDVYWLPQGTTALPDFSRFTPVTTLYAEVLNAPKREFTEGFPGVDDKRLEWFGIRFTGGFVVAAAGDYTFKIFSKDGAKVYVDDALILDNDGLKGSPVEKSGPVKLTAGQHKLKVDYFKAEKGQAALQLFVIGPDKQEKPWLPAF